MGKTDRIIVFVGSSVIVSKTFDVSFEGHQDGGKRKGNSNECGMKVGRRRTAHQQIYLWSCERNS